MIKSIFFSLSQNVCAIVLIYICIKMQSNKMNHTMQYLLNNIALFLVLTPEDAPFSELQPNTPFSEN